MSTIAAMSGAVHVNAPYLRKVLDKLRDHDIVATQRGTGGGIYLTVDINKLTILDILKAVDLIPRIESCPLGQPDHMDLCPLHAELDKAISKVEEMLGSRTIGELLANRRSASRCGFPQREELYQL